MARAASRRRLPSPRSLNNRSSMGSPRLSANSNAVRAATQNRIDYLMETMPTNRLLVFAGIAETIANLGWVAETSVMVERKRKAG